MRKIFPLLIFALVLIFAFLMLKNYQTEQNQGKRELIDTKNLQSLSCDLNQKSCEYNFKERQIFVEFQKKPIQSLDENILYIKNLGNYNHLNAKIYALNMYMGEIIPEFEKINHEDYKSSIVISTCPLDLMRYRAELFDGDKPLGFYFDFDVKK
ncbi:hypothetical protein DMB92_01040 [Campylobacter sp. MIT 99-7217]|nr:hypothetical protein DMB92_01040 [Campylobacter sp. MIT 99-7217]